MKNSLKRLLATLAAFATIFMLTTTSVMANPGIIDLSAKGSITIHKFDSTGEGAGVGEIPDGTEISDTSGYGKPLGGIRFTITWLPYSVEDATVAKGLEYIANTPIGDRTQYSKLTAGDGIVVYDDLAVGVYLVQEEANSGIASVIAPFLVSIPMTNPVDNSSWLYDVHVYPKNTVLPTTISKAVLDEDGLPTSGITADVGDEVSWMITPSIPATIASIDLANGAYFFITDELDSRLTYVSTVVQLVDSTGTIVKTFASGTDFTLTAPIVGDASGTIKVDFNIAVGIDALEAALENSHTIQILVKTTINQTALEDLSVGIKNTATLNYNNTDGDPSLPVIPVTPLPVVTLGGVALYKWYTDASLGDVALPGATFTVYASEQNAKDGNAIQLAGVDVSLVSDANGYVYFSGKTLEEALATPLVDGQTFYLVETKAPTGFELLNEIIVAPLSTTASAKNIKLSEGFVLPITGGIGTLLYTLVGLSLIGVAVGIFVFKKSKNRKSKKA